MELVCPAGNLPSLKAAVDQGADAVYIGFKDETNARNFAGLNFTSKNIQQGIEYAHQRGSRLFVAINTFPQPNGWHHWTEAVDRAAEAGVDAIILADLGILDYAANRWPDLNLHLSVQGSATNYEALHYLQRTFGIRRAVIPRVLSAAQVAHLSEHSPVPLELFGFGSLCVMVEGRCLLSSYATGRSPNTYGACSPGSHVEWVEQPNGITETRLGGILVDRFGSNEHAGYPTICKGRFEVQGKEGYAIEEPTSLNTLELLPEMMAMGIGAVKIEGRQRSPAYVSQVTRVWRDAIDACKRNPSGFQVQSEWNAALSKVAEGAQTTLGAYHRAWQ
ncbi:MAG: U32 family peptidase [Gammaproteobacteria bacterium]|jgi:putative protease|nr:U32 family peptidase [Gammaproteobacteria bacterium]MBT4608197.1 U32 family peptidase [Thiotrichales bacterium]MBT3472201.1 U32 family peptidase [Gammaproteobacteria bacterium]MBT4079922.1 U32 family peptidase [Gammaproteobacteria bacterium]MBT4329666.1 U32 family peptidase [Gammaproteobacteria bacterium]